MKKLFAVLTALVPIIYVGIMLVFLFIRPEDEILFIVLGGIPLFGLIVHGVHCVLNATTERLFLAVTNVWSIAVNLTLYIAEVVWWFVAYEQNRIAEQNGAMEGGLGLALLIVIYMPHWITYLMTRICASIHCRQALKNVCGSGAKLLHIILHLFPITDMISSIWVLCKVKAFLKYLQSPIEMK